MGCRKLQITDFFHRTDIRTSLTRYSLFANKAEKTHKRFFRSLSLQGEDLIAETNHTTSKTYLALHDGNGNVIAYVDSSDGSIVWEGEYSPSGKEIVSTGTKPCEFGFAGEFTDPETGLIMYVFRPYDPKTGRFLTRDPIGVRGGNNPYRITKNDLINMVDFLGLRSCQVSYNKKNIGELDVFRYLKYSEADPLLVLTDHLAGVEIRAGFVKNKEYKYENKNDLCCDEFQFIQIVNTNAFSSLTLFEKYYSKENVLYNIKGINITSNLLSKVDVYPNAQDPFYPAGDSNKLKVFDASFYDNPTRMWELVKEDTPIFWQAESCLVCVNRNQKKVTDLKCLTYGFTMMRESGLLWTNKINKKLPLRWKDEPSSRYKTILNRDFPEWKLE